MPATPVVAEPVVEEPVAVEPVGSMPVPVATPWGRSSIWPTGLQAPTARAVMARQVALMREVRARLFKRGDLRVKPTPF
jgi:hypothetical protein